MNTNKSLFQASASLFAIILAASIFNAHAQNDVFWRSGSTTGNWWDDSVKPWFYYGTDQARPDFGFNNNRLFIGNNNQTTMTVNGTFFQIGSLTIQSGASSDRTFNASSGGGISFRQSSSGFSNDSTGSQTFNVPIGVDVSTVVFRANNGSANTTFAGDFYLNGNTANFGGSSSTTSFALTGTVSGSGGQIVKQDSNFLILSGNNTYTGATTINGGTVQVRANNALGTTGAGTTIASGATLDFQNNVNYSTAESVTNNGGTIAVTSGSSTFAGGVTLGASSIYNVTGTQLTQSGVVTDGASTFGITKNGNGILVLGGNNTYDGSTTISGGSVAVTLNNALGSSTGGTTVASGTTLDFQNINYSTAEGVTNNGGSIAASTGTSTFAGGVTLGANSTYNVAGTQLTQSGVVTDGASSFSLTKSGAGILVLSADNTYDGGTVINAGTVSVAKDLALGNAPGSVAAANLTFGGGTLAVTTGFTLNSNRGITLNTGGGTIDVAASQNLDYGGVITGANSLAKSGSGTLSLSGANTYTGNTAVNAGTLRVDNNSALGTAGTVTLGANSSATAATLLVGSGITNSRALNVEFGNGVKTVAYGTSGTGAQLGGVTLNNSSMAFNVGSGGTLLFGGGVTAPSGGGDTGRLALDGGGTLIVTNAGTGIASTDRYQVRIGNGTMIIGAGTIIARTNTTGLGHAIDLGLDLNGSAVSQQSSLLASNGVTVSNSIYVSTASSAARVLGLSGTGTATFSGPVALNSAGLTVNAGSSGTAILSGAITDATTNGTSANTLTKTGSGTVILSGANTYSGINTVSNGTLSISAAGNLGNATGATAVTLAGGTLQSTTNMTLGSRGITVGTGGGTIEVSSGSLTNTAGLNGSTALSNATVNIASGGTLMGGGTLGAVTVQNGGIIAPGNSPGTLSVSSLTLDGGGSYNWELTDTTGTAGTGWDVITVGGGTGAIALNASSGSQFTINIIGTNPSNWAAGTSRTWDIIDGGSWVSAFDANAFAIVTTNFTASGTLGQFSVANNGGNLQLVYTASITDYAVNVPSGSVNQGDATGGTNQFTGGRSLIKTGAGTLVMTNGANDYTGTTTVQAGTIQIDVNAPANSEGALGTSSTAVAIGNSAAADAAGFNIGAANVTNSRDLSIVAGTGAADRVIGTTITGGTAVQAGNVNLATNATLSAASGGTMLYSGVLSNSGNITVTNGGTTVLSGFNIYSGTTTVANGATLVAADNAALGTTAGNTTVNSGGTLGLSNGITEDEVLNVAGTGVGDGGAIRNLSGNNTLTGSVTLAGATRVNSDAGLLTISNNINGANNALTLGGDGNTTIGGNITNSTAGLTKDGSGTVILSGANTYAGTTTINAGTLAISGGSAITNTGVVSLSNNAGATLAVNASETIGSLRGGGATGGNVSVASGQTLTVAESGAQTFSGAISGAGELTKSSNGTLTLGGANTYTGRLTINGGSVALTSGGTLGGTNAVRIASGATLNLNNVNATVASVAEVGTGNGGTISLGSGTLTVTGDAYGLFQNSISGTGGLTKNGTGTLGLYGTQSFTGALTVNAGELNSSVALASTNVTVSGGLLSTTTNSLADTAAVTVNGGTLRIGGSDAIGALSGSGGTVNITNGSGLTTTVSTTSTYAGAIVGDGKLIKAGGGTFTLSGANAYSGNTEIDAGALAIGGGNLASGSTIYVGSGTNNSNAALNLSGTTTLSNNMQVNVSGGSGTRTIAKTDATSQQASGAITLNTNAIVNVAEAGGNLNLSGVVSGSGRLTKSGSGTLVLSGPSANTMSGGVTVSAGEMVFGKNANLSAIGSAVTVDSGATLRTTAANQFGNNLATINGDLNLANNSQSLALRGSGTVTLGSATLTNTGTSTDTFSGRITGTGAIVKAGTGTAIFSGASDYTGTTTIGAGVLELQNAGGLGATNGATTVSANAQLRLSSASSMNVLDAITLNGTGTADNGALRSVAGANTVSGNITLGSNARIDAATAGSLAINGSISGGTNTLFVGAGQNVSIAGSISGSGNVYAEGITQTSLFKDGTQTLTLSGNNTYTGDTRINQGNVTVASGGSLGNGSDVFISTNGTLTVSTDTAVATLQEWGQNNGGTASIGNGATLTVNGNATNFFMNSVGGAGSLAKAGTGTMNLYGTQSYTGTTTVSAGKLSSAFALSSTNVSVTGGNFEANGANILGDSAIVGISGGTYTLGGNDTVGSFSISGGAFGGSNTLTAATYALNGGTVTANLGAGAATATGGTTALNGTLGATTVNVSGGTVNLGSANRLADTAAVTVSSGTLGMGAFNDTVGSLALSGGTLGGSGTLTASTYALNGGNINAVLGAGAITVGGGTNTLGSAERLNSGSSLTVNSGQLTLGGNETVSSLAGSGGNLALGDYSLTLGGNSYSNSFAGVISGNGSLVKNGTGYLRLSGNNTYGGGTFLNGGTLDSDSTNAFGTGFIVVGSGTTLNLESHNVANSITNNGGTILSSGTVSDVDAEAGQTTIGGDGSTVTQAAGTATVTVTGNDVTVNNVEGSAQVNIGGTGASVGTVSGGTVTLSNGATGATVTTASGGTVNANASGTTLGTVSGSAAVNVGGANGRVGTLSGGSVAANADGLVVTNFNGGNIAVASRVTVGLQSGSSAGVISGAGGIAKQGATTLTLSGANTYSGATTVEEGKLIVNGSVNSSAVTVDNGATIGGIGSVKTLTLNGMLTPGNSAGTFTSTSGASWNNGGVYNWEIYNLAGAPGLTGWDLFSVTGGTLNLNGITTAGGFTINLITLQSNNSTPGALTDFDPAADYIGDSAWMIASAPDIEGFDAGDFTLNASGFVGANGIFALEQRGGDLFLTYTGGGEPIPEPGTWAAAALLAGAAGYVRWRRRKQVEPKA